MGSNMAENHPVGFQWVMEAKLRGARIIHVDPRFTRTSAVADQHVPIRAGSDIAFLGGVVNHILQNRREFREYVIPYTNAATIIDERFQDTEDLDGLFSGWDEATKSYDESSWQYAGTRVSPAAGQRESGGAAQGEAHGSHGASGPLKNGLPPLRDESLEHPQCVFQILKRHFSRYTPELVEEACGVSRAEFLKVAEALCDNSGRERTTSICYAVGWTQHSVGVQYIRTAAIIQLLLGNMGRPGGGIMALRGHAGIQGSTDIPTLYNILPGYIPMPHAHLDQDLKQFVAEDAAAAGYWGHMPAYLISLLKAYFGDNATAANDYCFDLLPRITGDHSTYTTTLEMMDGSVKGYFLLGENPAVGSANSGLHRQAMAKLDWLVVRDLFEVESAAFWYDSPEIDRGETGPEQIGTEVFLLPAAAHTEKAGSFTNTQRLLQWRHQAVEPPGDCRSDLWFFHHLARIIRERLRDSTAPGDECLLKLDWHYPTEGPREEPSAEAVLREINGFGPDGRSLSGYSELKADGSTACGCWIYCGVYAGGENQAARRQPGGEQSWVAPGWGWAWPDNRRILYNRASADPEGRPWSERKRYVWWDSEKGLWTGYDTPDFKKDMPPDYLPPEGAEAELALCGDAPFVMQGDGRGWLYVPSGLKDGPLPAHYEPQESPVKNPLYRKQQHNPARQLYRRKGNPYNRAGDAFPFVMTSYRLTEHHTTGAMSRNLPYLAELQPAMFCEVGPELARLRGLRNGGWAVISTSRGEIEARVLVTDRVQSLSLGGRRVHQVGLPYHWGYMGLTKGGAANDLFALALDPNVHIQEVKAATCNVRSGRLGDRSAG